MKIMIVDDSSTMRRILKNCLSNLKYENIVEAGDGLEAQKVLVENKDVELALVDWNMPNMTGYELLQVIKSKDEFKGIKVIMVTTEAEKTNVIMAIKAGASNYVIKPFTPEIIGEKITETLAK